MTEELNDRQKAAISSQKNTVVKAGAGSGKTTVLALRYVRLITEGLADVENILTVTFTRKAAAEMYERIYTMLSEQARDPHVVEQLAAFDKARISTLDSFCTSIVREYAGLYGITPTFVQDQYEVSRMTEQTALSFILEHQDDEVIKRLIRDAGFEAVWKELFVEAALAYLPLGIDRDFAAMNARQELHLRERLDAVFSEAGHVISEIVSIDGGAGKTVRNAQDALRVLPDLRTLKDRLDGTSEQYRKLKEVVESCTFRLPGKTSNPELLRFKELAEKCRDLFDEISLIAVALSGKQERDRLFELLDLFKTRVHREKRSRGVLSYPDVQQMAVAVLRENRDIRDYYKQKYRYIMIDEFQDNNALQKDLLYLLAENRQSHQERPSAANLEQGKLFFVGDEKQSIYRFRGADVSVFRRLGEELENNGGESIDLAANYRSEPELVDFFNVLFPGVFRDAEEEYEARFEPLESGSESHKISPRISLFYKPFDQNTEEGIISSDDAEAYYLASFIRRIVENRELEISDNGKTRYAGYDDIAILLRSTSNQVKYERMLRRFDVPYVTGSVRTLFLEAPVNDIYHLLQLAVYPEDRIAYAGLLRSPFVGISDSAVVRILLEEQAPFCWEPGRAPVPEEDQEKYTLGRELYFAIRSQIDAVPITDLISAVWYRYGYRYMILKKPAYHGYLEFYDYLWHLAYQSELRGECTAEFLDFLRNNLGKFERLEEMELPKDIEAGVQIMTIHKAKGLEFPVVILANMGNTGRKGEEKRAFFHISEEYGLTFNLPDEHASAGNAAKVNYFYNLVEEENRKKELAEVKRLLYVGATRAESHLFFSGVHNRNNRGANGRTVSLLNLALDSLGLDWSGEGITGELPEGITVETIGNVSEDDLQRHSRALREIDREKIDSFYKKARKITFSFRKKEFSAVDFDYTELSGIPDEGAEGIRVAESEEEGTAAAFGTLCHFILEQRIQNRYDRDSIPSSLLRAFPEGEHKTVVQSAESLAQNFFSSALGERLAQARTVETELPFLLRKEEEQGEIFINGRVDLFFEDEQRGYIVDFKTDGEVVPEIYMERMSVYREALHAITHKPVISYLYYLRHSRIIEL